MEREVGGGIGMGNTCKPMAVLFQCMTKFTTNKKKKKKKERKNSESLQTKKKKKKRIASKLSVRKRKFILLFDFPHPL